MITSLWAGHKPALPTSLEGGGTATGIDALLKGEADIANASRLLTDMEEREAETAGIELTNIVIARDALAIISGPGVNTDSLSIPQLADLLSGKIRNWKELGGPDLPVVVIGRNRTSGTYQYLLDLLHFDNFAPGHQELKDNAAILEAVRKTKGAVGYVNIGSLIDREGKPYKYVWVMSLYIDGDRAHSPYNREAVSSGDYPLTRPLYQYVRVPCSKEVSEFLRFELDEKQQAKITSFGYFPLTPIDLDVNRRNMELL
ncbi:MAG: PstS family phosphate ABC transporter substrate-binding protein [Bacteroidia bacterium]|nr:PstS family phosphate ABC transporter substrate-binding protein [Bacteroidia bacterium]